MDARGQRRLDAVASPIRREILWLVWDAELSVGDIGAHFDITGPTLSSHLTTLRDAGLVTVRSDRNFRRYRANQDALAALVPFLATNDARWVAADDIDERDRASSSSALLVEVAVEVGLDQATAFESFTDERQYSGWLGVPVRIRDRRFRTTLEWGTEVRGTYEVVAPPDLLAMRWDFDDDAVPVPGRGLVAYLRVRPTRRGSRVEVHQHASDTTQAEFLTAAWSLVLGRFAEAHTLGASSPASRTPRPKRRAGAADRSLPLAGGPTMEIPKPSDADRQRFLGLVPDAPGVETKPMFGNLGAFVNGNMFMGLFGAAIGVKLPDAARDKLLAQPGAGPFGPAERPMGGYVTLPPTWTARKATPWIDQALAHVASLPPKQPKTKPAKRKAKA